MENYDEIARQAVKNVTGFYPSYDDIAYNCQGIAPLYQCAYEAARLQAERFNKDLDDSYIESLSKEELN